jgi:Type IV secretory pathway, VirB3-like protein/CagE, TrbE, VirB family, component of type IV transporter system
MTEELAEDVLHVAATRPALLWGVPFELAILIIMITGIVGIFHWAGPIVGPPLFNSGDKATSQIEGLEDLKDDVASGRVSMGDHHLVLTSRADRLRRQPYADSPRELEKIANRVDGILSNAGAAPAMEDKGA